MSTISHHWKTVVSACSLLALAACETTTQPRQVRSAPSQAATETGVDSAAWYLEVTGSAVANPVVMDGGGRLGLSSAGVSASRAALEVPSMQAAAYSGATVLDFEDVPPGQSQMFGLNPYHGVIFSNESPVYCPTIYHWDNYGYGHPHSGGKFLFNGCGGADEYIRFPSAVTFNGAWVGNPHVGTNPKQFWFEGWRNGVKVGESQRVTIVGGAAMVWADAGFSGPVDKVYFRRTFGWWVADDITFNGTPTPSDATPPVITPTVTGTLGSNGWYTSDVQISWTVVDNESAISSKTGCDASSVTTDTQGVTFTCSATSAGGTASQSVTVKRDASAPTVSNSVAGTAGLNGWYTSDVTVTWTTADPTSGIASSTGCTASTLNTDGSQTYTCTATNGAGLATTQSVTVKRDATPPAITPSVVGPLGNNGWYVGDVSVSFTALDPTSGIAASAGCTSSAVTTDTPGVSFTCSATNGAGLSASQTASVKRDATKPAIGYTGNAGSYTVDQTVAITCSASDAMSGLAATTCQNVNGDAYTFSLGSHGYSATAADNAGNGNAASTTFTVQVTYASLCNLVRRWVTQPGVANSLCQKLDNASAAAARGNATAAGNIRDAFVNEVQAQSGKFVPASRAPLLIQLAQAL